MTQGTDSDPEIRKARPDEAAAIAAFHVRDWRETYAGIAPAEARARRDEAQRLPLWRAALAAPETGQAKVLAWKAGVNVGLVRFGPSSRAALAGRAGGGL